MKMANDHTHGFDVAVRLSPLKRLIKKLGVSSLVLVLFWGGGFATIAQAEFGSPPGQGTPKSTAGGGSRPPNDATCAIDSSRKETLVALAPSQSIGRTAQVNPALWVQIPPTTAKTLEFSLFQDQKGIYQVNLPVEQPGLLKVTLPPQVQLETGKPYYWTAALVCNPARRTEDWVVDGWIGYDPPQAEFQRRLAQASPVQQVTLYAQSGFWYEALNAYLTLRQAHAGHLSLSEPEARRLQTEAWTTIADLLPHSPMSSPADRPR